VNWHMRDGGWLVGRMHVGEDERGGPCDYEQLLDANLIPLPAAFWTRKIALKTAGFDPFLECAHDYDYWLRLFKIQQPLFCNEVLAVYHSHPGQMTNTRAEEMREHAEKAREKARHAIA